VSEFRILMMPDVLPREENLEGAQDLAWSHAVGVAQLTGSEVGSDDFIDTHAFLLSRYTECADHAAFVQHTSLRILQAVLDTSQLALVIPKNADKGAVLDRIQNLSDIVCSGLMWFFSSYPHGWIEDARWESFEDDSRGVAFTFNLPEKTEGGEDDGSK
jgi:hypothetical protein